MRTGTKPSATKTNYVVLPGIPATQKNTSAEFNWLVDKATNPADVTNFTVSVKADDEYSFADYTQQGVLNFVKDGSVTSGGIGNGMSGVIVCNGAAINFSADFDVIRNDEFTASSRYFVDFKWNGSKFVTTIKKVGVNVYGAGIGEAPIDGNQYARKDAGWEQVVASGGGAGTFDPVADITALKAIDTTDGATWKDKWALIVEGEGKWYRLDRDSSAAESLPNIVSPTTGSGRWFRISEIDYENIFFAALTPDFGVITRPYDFKVVAKADTGGTATITTSADAAYTLGATVTAGGYLKVTGDTLNMRSSLTIQPA